MIKLSFQNLMRNKSRSFLTTIGIIIGVAAIVSLVSISDGIDQEANSALGGFQYVFLMEAGALDDTLSYIDTSVIPKVRRVRGIKEYTSIITVAASSINGKQIDPTDFSTYALIGGIEPEKAMQFKDTFYWYKPTSGRMISPGEEGSVLVTKSILEDYNLFIGSNININGENFRIIGTITVGGNLGGMADMIVMDIEKAREFSQHTDEEVSIINVLPENIAEVDKLITRLDETFEGELSVYTADDATQVLGEFLGSLTVALWVVSAIAAVVGGVNVMNTMLMSVMERIQEFGVLKAVGWKDKHIVLMIIFEAMIIGLIGGLLGVLFGFVGSELVEVVSGIPTSVSTLLIGQVLLFAMGIGMVSSIYPAFIASQMSPIEAVTYE